MRLWRRIKFMARISFKVDWKFTKEQLQAFWYSVD